jgi:hypothetical protein
MPMALSVNGCGDDEVEGRALNPADWPSGRE